jgi:hypothetical protein
VIDIPPYVISVSHENMPELRSRWEGKRPNNITYTHLFDPIKETPPSSGRVVLVDKSGVIRHSIPVYCPHGITQRGNRIFVTTPWHIASMTGELEDASVVASNPSFNLLHTLRPCVGGSWLVASTGMDTAIKLSRDFSEEALWDAGEYWTASNTGVASGRLGINGDYRGWDFPTEMHATHLNSALESDDGRWLVSLFHQGLVVTVDPENGTYQVLLAGLRYPHALRRVGEGEVSLADSARGQALKLVILPNRVLVNSVVQAETNWLQDAYFGDNFLLMLPRKKYPNGQFQPADLRG